MRAADGEEEGTGGVRNRPIRPLDKCAPYGRTHIYFLSSGPNGPIKIGIAACVGGRIRMLQTGNPEPIEYVASCEVSEVNSRRIECWLHARFEKHRLRGEWFERCELIDGVISDVQHGEDLEELFS